MKQKKLMDVRLEVLFDDLIPKTWLACSIWPQKAVLQACYCQNFNLEPTLSAWEVSTLGELNPRGFKPRGLNSWGISTLWVSTLGISIWTPINFWGLNSYQLGLGSQPFGTTTVRVSTLVGVSIPGESQLLGSQPLSTSGVSTLIN